MVLNMYQRCIFISHSWAYPDHYKRISEWVFGTQWSASGVEISFINSSVPKDNPIHFAENDTQLKNAIWDRIRASHIVVIPTGMYSTHSKWINKEIEGANFYGKPILGVNPWGQERKSISVQQSAKKVVGWNKNSVVNAIWEMVG